MTRPKTVFRSSTSARSSSSSGSSRASKPSAASRPTSRAIAATVLRIVAGDDAHADALLGEVVERLRGIGAHVLAEGQQHDRTSGAAVGGGVGLARASCAGLCASTSVRRPVAARSRACSRTSSAGSGRRRAGEHHLGTAEHPRAGRAVVERDGAPLARRRERDACSGLGIGQSVNGSARQRAVALASGSAPYQASTSLPAGGGIRRSGCDVVEDDVALGEGAGLVEADDVDAGQALDGGQFLHQHLSPGELHRADGEGDARHEHEPERDHRDDRRDRADGRIAPGAGLDGLSHPAVPRHLGVQHEQR